MIRFLTLAIQVALLAALVGCIAPVEPSEEGEHLEEGATALISENALIPNALIPNALIPNALIPNALSPSALSPSALSPSAQTALKDPGLGGTLSRMLVKYAVGCALTPNQSFSFTWTDALGGSHQETYKGSLGIAPAWATGPLNGLGKEMVSACLAGRTNYYGAQVTISMRSLQSPLKTLVGSAELAGYAYVEGAFWGNIFAAQPHISACYTTADVSHSKAALRECATGHVDTSGVTWACGGIQIVGSCESMCKVLNGAGQYYPECTDPAWGKSQNIVTTALP